MTSRMPKQERTEHLLDVAVILAAKHGWDNLTRDRIGIAAGVSMALITQRLGNKVEMLRNVMRRAIAVRNVQVVAQGLARNDRTAKKAPDDLKQEAAGWLASL